MKPDFEVKTRTRHYAVFVGHGILSKAACWLPKDTSRVFIFTDHNIAKLHIPDLSNGLEEMGFTPVVRVISAGEEFKSLSTTGMLIDFLLENHAMRTDALFALGGGVIGDIGGFVASIFKRGMKLVQVPTTLLAQVDSSLGGKTAVNHPLGKNLIGTFYQPHFVVADVRTLASLPEKSFIDGLSEVVKYSVIMDPELMSFLVENKDRILCRDEETLATIVRRCLKAKARIVEADEAEEGHKRLVLNFGHTVGHALETCSDNEISHGQAVAIGMAEEARFAVKLGLLDEHSLESLLSVLSMFGLPTEMPSGIDVKQLTMVMKQDKKRRGSKLVIPMLVKLGGTELRAIDSIY